MYFNNAATTWPKPEIVYETTDACFRSLNSPERTTSDEGTRTAAMMSTCREEVAGFLRNNILRGLLYGVIMTIISAGLLVPYAYVPEQGYGLFLFDGPDGWKLPFGVLVWHLIYGLFLGLLWNPGGDREGAEAAA